MIAAKTMGANVVSQNNKSCTGGEATKKRENLSGKLCTSSDLHDCRRLTMKYLLVAAALLALTATPAAAIQ